MKNYLFLILSLISFTGCHKDPDPVYFKVVIQKESLEEYRVEIDDKSYSFTETEFTNELTMPFPSVLSVSTAIGNDYRDEVSFSVYDKNGYIGSVNGTGYVWIIIPEGQIKGSSSSSSNGTTSHLCGAPTQDGTPVNVGLLVTQDTVGSIDKA